MALTGGTVRIWRLVGSVLVVGTAFAVGTPTASASCAAPTVTVTPSQGAAGAAVRIAGQGWATDCNDSQVVINGTPSPAPTVAPDSIRLYFQQDGNRQLLATLTADRRFVFSAQVKIPGNAHAGAAQIVALGARAGTQTAAFTVSGSAPVGQLPFTGTRTTTALKLACLSLLAGIWLTAFGRRMRHR